MSDSTGGLRHGQVVAVVGASGGSGTTTLVAALSRSAVRSGRMCVAVDLQRGGPGLDVAYAVEHLPGIRWPDLAGLAGAVDAPGLLARLPSWRGVGVLAHARDPGPVPDDGVVAAVVEGLATRVDVVLVDAPRDVTPAVTGHIDTAVLVAGTDVLELAALAATGRRLAGEVGNSFVVLRGRRASAGLGDEVSRALDLPVLGWLRDDQRVARSLRQGRGPSGGGPVAELATDILSSCLGKLGTVAS